MVSIWESPFLVVDVETNGSDPLKNRITEIACLKVQGGEIIEEYSSLVNPHQFIPPFISQMTGITNEMAFKAPEAKVVVPHLKRLMPDDKTIFVAHNVKFDWSFVRHTFMRENESLDELNQLCTYKLARKLLPNDMKKNVGALATFFNINMKNRHRAFDDAKATALILLELLEIAESEHGINSLHELLSFQNKRNNVYKFSKPNYQKVEQKLKTLPDSPGVYYYKDRDGEIIYIGKAKSLKRRVNSYFNGKDNLSSRTAELLKTFESIDWVETESELHALVLESKEIKKVKPKFNVADKKYTKFPFLSITTTNPYPKLVMAYSHLNNGDEFYGPFRNYTMVEEICKIIDKNFRMRKCDEDLKPSVDFPGCIYFQMNRCSSPCNLKQSQEDYLLEVDKVRKFLSGFSNGVIDELELQMESSAEELHFEKAKALREQISALKRVFHRTSNVSTSINKNNLILILPNSAEDKTVDIFFISQGNLKEFRTVGRKANLDFTFDTIKTLYENESELELNPAIIDEIRIVTSWIFRQQEKGKVIYTEHKSISMIFEELKKVVANYEFVLNYEDNINYYI
jgi:DNA polymerase-3 subunit epsilon